MSMIGQDREGLRARVEQIRREMHQINFHGMQTWSERLEVVLDDCLEALAETPRAQKMKPIRAHVKGCKKALSVPVDLCSCGGRDFLPDQSSVAPASEHQPLNVKALIELIDAVPCVERCECSKPRSEHTYWEDRVYDVNGYRCPGPLGSDYRFSPTLTASYHKDARVEALADALAEALPVAETPPSAAPSIKAALEQFEMELTTTPLITSETPGPFIACLRNDFYKAVVNLKAALAKSQPSSAGWQPRADEILEKLSKGLSTESVAEKSAFLRGLADMLEGKIVPLPSAPHTETD